jgi:Cys-tRNA(Pro)/Cys-tRNA(Cys) deacylase
VRKTNAVRILEARGIACRVESYDVDLEDLSATSVAAKIGIPPERLLKTLVVRGRVGCYFAVLRADAELDLKTMAKLTGDHDVSLVPQREIQELTGYLRGGVTVPGAKKAFPVYLDASAVDHGEVSVSAGVRGQQVLLAPADYARAVAARVAPIARQAGYERPADGGDASLRGSDALGPAQQAELYDFALEVARQGGEGGYQALADLLDTIPPDDPLRVHKEELIELEMEDAAAAAGLGRRLESCI